MQSIKDMNILKSAGIEYMGERTCETCGNTVPIYKRNGEEHSVCLKCKTNNLSKQQTEGYEPPKRREMTKKARLISYIPPELENVTFESYIPKTESQQQAKQLALDVVNGEYTSLLFQGDPGTGKSHLFRCAARELAKQKISWQENGQTYQVRKNVLFAKVPELMKLIQSTYNNRSSLSEDIILETINQADVLILDEIAGERSKDSGGFETWSGDILYQILDHRQGKSNLYNLNYSSAEVKKKYGETHGKRILSRMSAGAKILKVDGPDHRMKGLE
ncbi:AAA family ATPase [Virgibacillus sp. FSP13]